ncbi:MAG: 3-methyl-2-oxobutanoate hydroxymethyltransferase [Peptostreptococcaceae bacterium]|nr:3-methyl-2-oxobutanoate hydroxymethyltransferase [Peptostreptococcaceae bacterium]
MRLKKITTRSFQKFKENGKKITMMTAYDYSTAKLIDEAGIDSILVGDSLGNVVLGYEDTIYVTMEDMIHHTRAVARGAKRALVIGDMPYLSYHTDVNEAVKNAGRLIQEGHAQAVKLEGGREILDVVRALVRAKIPVVGHIGLTPQSVNQMGGYLIQGKNAEDARRLLEDAKLLDEAGVFAIVIECVPKQVAEKITQAVKCSTIGIGAGNVTDGQVLVSNDAFGTYSEKRPSFVRVFGNVGEVIASSTKAYIEAVERGDFPSDSESFHIDGEQSEEWWKIYGSEDPSNKDR